MDESHSTAVWNLIECQMEDIMICKHSDSGDSNGVCCAVFASRIETDGGTNALP